MVRFVRPQVWVAQCYSFNRVQRVPCPAISNGGSGGHLTLPLLARVGREGWASGAPSAS
jgi:hypothetical protein